MNLKFNCKKRSFLLLLAIIFTFNNVIAQKKAEITSDAVLIGKVAEADLQKPLEFATVSIYSIPDSSFVKGTITNKRGEFILNKLEAADYFIKVEHLGYQSYKSSKLSLTSSEKKAISSPVYLEVDAKSISEVKVEGNRQFARVELDKTVYNVSKSPAADGGSINDVLNTIPVLEVDAEG